MSDNYLMKTDNLLFSERPVSIHYSPLKAERFCSQIESYNKLKALKILEFSIACL